MRQRSLRWWILIVLAFCAATAAAQESANPVIESCLARLQAESESVSAAPTGPKAPNVFKLCPDLEQAVEGDPRAGWLPADWSVAITSDWLKDLQRQLDREASLPAATTIDTAGLQGALANLEAEHTKQVTWWTRLMEWLNRYMERDSESSSPWLTQWIEKIGQHQLALRIMGYALCALIVLSALWIVYRELKAADALGWRRRARGVEALPAGDASRAGIARDLERCDPVDRPSVVLELIAAAVARSEDKGTDPSATHRELAARLGLVIPQQRGVVDRLAACAERVRYAPSLPASADIDTVVRNGVAVLQSLVARRAQS